MIGYVIVYDILYYGAATQRLTWMVERSTMPKGGYEWAAQTSGKVS